MVATTTIGRRKARLMAVGAAVLAALGVWLIAELAFGMHLQAPAFDGSGQASDVSALDVAVVAVLLSLAGWGLLAILERLTAHARRVWLIVAPLALVLSLGTPLSGTGVTAADRIVLLLMHLAVGAVLIPALWGTSPQQTVG